jgi:hypothetical protein
MISEKSTQVNIPKTAHQSTAIIKIHIHSPKIDGVTTPPHSIIHKITVNKAKDVQSLKRLSHSKISDNLLGAPSSLNIDKTATGSVLHIKAPKSKQTKNGILNPMNGKI